MTLVVFTDLDGTLLDHETYSYAPARPALVALRARSVPLVLATSKTAAEVAQIHADLHLGDTPAIVENGAGIFVPGQPAKDASAYQGIRAALNTLPDSLRQHFQGFGDVEAADVARWTGLSLKAATDARTRAFSEPGLWHGTDDDLDAFRAALSERGIHSRHGGRFLTLTHGRNKADALKKVAKDLGATFTVALGDAPNDIEMLLSADKAVIIRNDHSTPLPPLPGEETGAIMRSEQSGPAGWNSAILAILAEAIGTTERG